MTKKRPWFKILVMLPNNVILLVYRLAYSVFRTSELIRQKLLKEKLQNYSVDIIESSYSGNIVKLKSKLSSLKGIVSFSSDVGYISYEDKGVLVNFIENIEKEITETRGKITDIRGDLEREMTPPLFIDLKDDNKESSLEKEVKNKKFNLSGLGKGNSSEDLPNNKENVLNFEGVLNNNSSEKSSEFRKIVRKDSSERVRKGGTGERREKVLDKIKQSGICFLKDVADLFPEHSERTKDMILSG